MSKVLDILNSQGARVGEYAIPENALENEKGKEAVHLAVVSFLAGLRAGTACTKTRGEVRGGGAKPFRQKGTGRARSGSSRNPVWTGGGVIFGPRPRSFAKKVNKKVMTLALRRAFTEKINDDLALVLDEFVIADHKTKSAVAVLKNLKLEGDSSVLMVVPEFTESVVCATGNLPFLALRKASGVNVYELLRYEKVLFTKDGLDAFIGRLA